MTSETAEEARDTKAASPPEEPRGVDPSTLPPADDEPVVEDPEASKAKHKTSHGTAPAPEKVVTAEPTPPSREPPAAKPRAVEPPPSPPAPTAAEKPALKAPAPDDDLASPYAGTKKAESVAAPKPAPKPKKAAVDCSSPFTVDENGIKRIRPECL
jgi:hypothetical protein